MAARNTSVSLGKHFTDFIDKQVESGRYNTASDVIRASLRLMEEREQHYAWLQAQIKEAEKELAEGKYREITPEFWSGLRREVDQRSAGGEKADPRVFS